jgi:hypothetical protein
MKTIARFAGRFCLCAAFNCLLLVAGSVNALSQVVLVSNLDQPGRPSPAFINTTYWDGVLFVTGDQPTLLNSVTLDVRGGDFAGSFYVTLYSDQNGVPGTPMAGGQLNGPTQPQDFSSFLTYSAAQPLSLAPNTPYWAVTSSTELGTDGQSYGMFYVSQLGSTTFTSDYGWQLPDTAVFSPDSGNSWISYTTVAPNNTFFLQVSGTVVPEPASVGLGLLGLFACVLRRRSRAVR